MEKHVLPDAIALSLTRVRRSRSAPRVGSFWALDGAWDRKKVCVGIGYDERGAYYLLQNVGRIFSDGRYVKPTRRSKPVKERYYGVGRFVRNHYVPVVPTGKTAKVLRMVAQYDREGYLRRKQYRDNYRLLRIGALQNEIAVRQRELAQLTRKRN